MGTRQIDGRNGRKKARGGWISREPGEEKGRGYSVVAGMQRAADKVSQRAVWGSSGASHSGMQCRDKGGARQIAGEGRRKGHRARRGTF